jgi:hypothetical protein
MRQEIENLLGTAEMFPDALIPQLPTAVAESVSSYIQHAVLL